ncbi:MAG: phage shock protein [Epulopiscium sp.]|uniref:Phage shock protein A n=1 Tax=Defluviitalea raffinosedens TaxID=1450156 RepID=A0A7C8LK66_9FIRM|nr:PspA/IM30 family protein [Defluviitalea raffinosedens]KAE9633207.1 phage shock protein A [Defluviitalea raffinosedens]MBM7686975.1 phage shock protein A [Defluviitalea raffinosedens]MBZ4668594.1 phage shock protein PspA [Defluviitaleaceae bacterium]MDK2787322.1 phage shock protein [Candidatus Epulonipiscium sp.]
MGIFNRMVNVIKANINDLIDKAEDPEKMLEQLILDMQEQYTAAKAQVAQAIADEKKLEREYEEQLKLQNEWAEKAELAVSQQNDDLAIKALKRKKEHEKLAEEYKIHLDDQKQVTEKLKNSLKELNDKIEEAKRKKELLIARSKRAKAQETVNKTFSELNDTSAFDSFARMESKIEAMEDKVKAQEELNNEVSENTLDKEFEQLEKARQDLDVMDELAALKAKMGK